MITRDKSAKHIAIASPVDDGLCWKCGAANDVVSKDFHYQVKRHHLGVDGSLTINSHNEVVVVREGRTHTARHEK